MLAVIITKSWKQPKHPTVEKWLSKLWDVYGVKCILAIRSSADVLMTPCQVTRGGTRTADAARFRSSKKANTERSPERAPRTIQCKLWVLEFGVICTSLYFSIAFACFYNEHDPLLSKNGAI